MPTTLLDENVCGMKWVSVFSNNPKELGCSNVSGVIILSSLTDGFPIAIMDGTLITSLRTACVGAAADYNYRSKIELINMDEQFIDSLTNIGK